MTSGRSINIYLDQKDYSCMARGLNGEDPYKPYAAIYDFLKDLSDSGRVKIYFSWTHIVESLRYYDLYSQLWKRHCSVVDTLTKGNCIVYLKDLQKRELDLFLCDHLGIESRFSKSGYAFGRYRDAVPWPKNLPIGQSLKNAIESNVLTAFTSEHDRRAAQKKLEEKGFFCQVFSNMSEEHYRSMVAAQSNQTDSFVCDMLKFLDRETFIDFMTGDASVQQRIFERFVDSIFGFSTLVNRYSQVFPELRRMAEFSDKSFEGLKSLITAVQRSQNDSSDPFDFNQLKADIINDFAVSLEVAVDEFGKEHEFSEEEVMDALKKSKLSPITSIYSMMLFRLEYLKRHIGTPERARKPKISDTPDLINLGNLPYVDVFVTDSFMAEMVKRIAKTEFNTTVFKNLFQTREWLENQLAFRRL